LIEIENCSLSRSQLGGIEMKFKYFPDTDTAHVEFKGNDVNETKEISENIYIDIDAKGNLVGMTTRRDCCPA
jgi:uncharacterized protein YuzE